MNSLLHIAPQLPPAIDGVGDYCWNLWKHWPETDWHWQFLAAHNAAATAAHWTQVTVRAFELNAASLARELERTGNDTVVLHYVGYGFQPKGIPVWLPRALRVWRAGKAERRLVTMFHEMYARSLPWRSPFWVAPMARKIIRELVAVSDAWVTSCERYFHQLTTEFAATPGRGRIIPIGSNIPLARPRPESTRQTEDAKLRIAIFGLAGTRLRSLQRHGRLLHALQGAGQLETVTLLGKSGTSVEERRWQGVAKPIGTDVNWRQRFDLSAEEVSAELSAHDCGLLANEPDILTKSGVFAALANHGVIPIVSTPRREALPENVRAAVLANDDSSQVGTVVRQLGNEIDRQRLRLGVLEFARDELAWSRIGQQWLEVLHRFTQNNGADRPSSAEGAGTLHAQRVLEVTA
jgi:hypothetical protein